jgi:hypothetical protein
MVKNYYHLGEKLADKIGEFMWERKEDDEAFNEEK